MTEPNVTHSQIINMITTWQSRLGLSDWVVAVTWAEGNPEVDGHACHMKVQSSNYYKRATIEIGTTSMNFDKMPECIERDVISNGIYTHLDYVEVSIVHELLHLAMRDVTRTLDLVSDELHPGVRNILNETQSQAEEGMVEMMAQALVSAWKLDH